MDHSPIRFRRLRLLVVLAAAAGLACHAQFELPDLRINFDASLDQSDNGTWESTAGITNRNWNMGAGVTLEKATLGTALTGAPAGITAAYNFPNSGSNNAADRGTTTRYDNVFNENQPTTWEFWLQADDLATDQVVWEAGGSGDGSALTLHSNGNYRFTLKDSGNNLVVEVAAPVTGSFHQVAVTYDRDNPGTTDSLTLYVRDKDAPGYTLASDTGVNVHDWAGGNDAGIGGFNDSETGGTTANGNSLNFGTFDGQIAINRIYQTRALSQAEISNNFGAVLADDVYLDLTGTWQTQANWNTNLSPTGAQNAFVTNSLSATVDQAGMLAKSLTVGSSSGLAPGAGTVTVATGDLSIANAVIVGHGTHTGTLNLDGGTLTTGKITSGTGTSTLNFNGGTLAPIANNDVDFLQGLTTANIRNGGATIDTKGFNASIAQDLVHSTIGGDNATDGGLTKNGDGILTLTGTNSYTGVTRINSGTLQVGDGGVDGTLGANNTTNNSALVFNNSSDTSYAAIISGSGSVEKAGTGTLTLSTNHSYGGDTTVSAGTLEITNRQALGNSVGKTIVQSGATLVQNTNTANVDETLEISGGGAAGTAGALVAMAPGNDMRYAGTIKLNDDATIAVAGSGPDNGEFQIRQGVNIGSHTLTLNNASDNPKTELIVSNGNAITGSGNMILTRGPTGGEIVFRTNASNHTGSTTVSAGAQLRLRAENAISHGTSNVVVDGDLFFQDGTNFRINNLTGSGRIFSAGGVENLVLHNSTDTTFAGTILNKTSGNGRRVGITKTGPNTVSLTGNNTYTEPTTVSAGTLRLGGSGSIAAASAAIVGAGATLYLDSDATSFANNSSGSGTIRKGQQTTLAVSGNNTGFNGRYQIDDNGGTLRFTSANALGAPTSVHLGADSTLDVAAVSAGNGGIFSPLGTTFSGNGTIDLGAGNVFDWNGTTVISPGASPDVLTIGTIPSPVTVTPTDGATYNWELFDVNGLPGTGYDGIAINGNLDLTNLTTDGGILNIFGIDADSDPILPPSLDISLKGNTSPLMDVLSVTGTITGFDADNFDVNAGNLAPYGFFTLTQNGQLLQLQFTSTVPEPGTWALFALLFAGCIAMHHPKKK